MPDPLVSIIIPTAGRPKLFPIALESVVKQDYPNLEIIIVDDNDKSDKSGYAKIKMPSHRKFIAVFHGTKMGAPVAYNSGLKAATGKYVGILADDDRMYKDHVSSLVKVLESNPLYRVAYSDFYRVNAEMGGRGEVSRVISKGKSYSKDFNRDDLLKANYIPHPCVLHEKSLTDEVGQYDETLDCLIDWDMFRRMAMKTSFTHLRKVTGEYYFFANKTSRISDLYKTDNAKWIANNKRVTEKKL